MLTRTTLATALLAASTAAAQVGTAFTYQGRLTLNGQPAEGPHDLYLRLWPGENAVIPVGSPVELDNVQVHDGLFTVSMDFGAQFHGGDRWLSIAVRPGAGGSYTSLTPRQRITPAPYALSAASLSLPVSQTGATSPSLLGPNPLLNLNQTGTAAAILGQSTGPGAGVVGLNTGPGPGVHARATGTGPALLVDGGPIMVAGAPDALPAFWVSATSSNTVNGWVTIDHPLMNGDPNIVAAVTPFWIPNLAGGGQPVHPVPVYIAYDSAVFGGTNRWQIRGVNFAPIPIGACFHVIVIKR